MSDPTKEQVQTLWAFMTDKFRSVVVPKSDSEFMHTIAKFLSDAKIITDPELFMSGYTTTIGNKIYTPFEIGTENALWTLWGQVVVCAHEHHHIVQQGRLGAVLFDWQYLTDADARARFEAEAYLSAMELNYWRYGQLGYTPDDLAHSLRGYGCNDDQVAMGAESIRLLSKTVLAGGVVNETSAAVIQWLEEHAPEVREL